MMQGCNAELRRVITMCRRLPVVEPATSSTRRYTRVVTQEGKSSVRRKHVCPGCRRCTYAFMVAQLGLLQFVRSCRRLWRLGALPRGAFRICRSLCWLLEFYQVWQFEPFESAADSSRMKQHAWYLFCWQRGGAILSRMPSA